ERFRFGHALRVRLLLELAQRIDVRARTKLVQASPGSTQPLRQLLRRSAILARRRVDRIEPALDLAQPLRVELDAVAVASQIVHASLQLYLPRLKPFKPPAHPVIESERPVDLADNGIHPCKTGMPAFRKGIDAELCRLDQARRMREPRVLLRQLLP